MELNGNEPDSQTDDPKLWVKTPVSNLVRYVPSGIYFARAKVRGKLIRRSLKTNVLSVAKLRLADLLKEEHQSAESSKASSLCKMTFGDALAIYRQRVKDNPDLKERAKEYRMETVVALLRSWPGLETLDLKKMAKAECLNWRARFAKCYGATRVNGTISTLRQVVDIAVESGARYDNPARAIKLAKVKAKELRLPEAHQFNDFVSAIDRAGGRFSGDSADLIRFLAFGGFRISEAANIKWADCDFERKEIVVRGDPETGTKNWTVRRVPMIPDMRQLLEQLRTERPAEPPEAPVMRVRECQKAMDRAARKLGMYRMTHHDLRHLFATRCIESGVDVPTVSRWLGHKDGGALAMKVYGHLREHHSVAIAQRVTFSPNKASNVVQSEIAGS